MYIQKSQGKSDSDCGAKKLKVNLIHNRRKWSITLYKHLEKVKCDNKKIN